MNKVKCTECSCLATEVFTYPTSMGQVVVNLCQAHAKAWWDKFKNTNSGQGLSIRPVSENDTIQTDV